MYLDGLFVLWTVKFIYCMIFHFKGWVFGDLDDDILDGDYVICNDFFLSEMKYLVFSYYI